MKKSIFHRLVIGPAVFASLVILALLGLSGCGSNGNSSVSGSSGSSGGGSTGGGGASAPNALLKGQYAFSLSGSTTVTFVPIFMAGSFTADGAGNITAGIEDINQINQNGVPTLTKGVAVTGTYSIGSDGRGTLNFTTGVTQTFKFVVENGGHGQLIRFDSGATGSGTFDLQSASAFTLASLQGGFVFNWNGTDVGFNPFSGIGAFTLSSAGAASGGAADVNDGGSYTQQTFSGTFQAPDSNGHGTAGIKYGSTGITYGYDIISNGRILLIELDSTAGTVGEADHQTGAFVASSFAGTYAFLLGGVNTNGILGIVGQISAALGAVASSDAVQNEGGSVPIGTTFPGTYTFAPTAASVTVNGRFTLVATEPSGFTDNFVLYLVSPSEAFVMETDSDQLTSGEFVTQTGAPFSSSSFNGNYGLNFSGIDSAGAEIDVAGQVTSGGTSTLTAGTIDINDEDLSPTTTVANAAISGGNYTVVTASTGRSNLAFTASGGPFAFWFYFVSPNQVFILEDDSLFVSVGSAMTQPAIP